MQRSEVNSDECVHFSANAKTALTESYAKPKRRPSGALRNATQRNATQPTPSATTQLLGAEPERGTRAGPPPTTANSPDMPRLAPAVFPRGRARVDPVRTAAVDRDLDRRGGPRERARAAAALAEVALCICRRPNTVCFNEEDDRPGWEESHDLEDLDKGFKPSSPKNTKPNNEPNTPHDERCTHKPHRPHKRGVTHWHADGTPLHPQATCGHSETQGGVKARCATCPAHASAAARFLPVGRRVARFGLGWCAAAAPIRLLCRSAWP